jgi:hypothetical protein
MCVGIHMQHLFCSANILTNHIAERWYCTHHAAASLFFWSNLWFCSDYMYRWINELTNHRCVENFALLLWSRDKVHPVETRTGQWAHRFYLVLSTQLSRSFLQKASGFLPERADTTCQCHGSMAYTASSNPIRSDILFAWQDQIRHRRMPEFIHEKENHICRFDVLLQEQKNHSYKPPD